VFIIPTDAVREGAIDHDGALAVKQAAEVAERLKPAADEGSAHAIRRAMVLTEVPSVGDGEMTAKGNINFRKLLMQRAALVERLYDNADPATIRT
jgi:feruloyl-CoA synthase